MFCKCFGLRETGLLQYHSKLIDFIEWMHMTLKSVCPFLIILDSSLAYMVYTSNIIFFQLLYSYWNSAHQLLR